ncbi:terpene synthase family protein [Flavobacterium sp. PL02]|uniref:class 1 isoprenoid biosynthesis enzyme n=1 Tax=Flavobacterium sp. PL02 TaxID=3088354 RepID=UPI002B22700C|nr:terpene synthase family protein [Flavobacterium sp. PL02]MEA9414263.1 terpene synthase family protein [Flavobacterium sp. PL02]
MQNNTLPNPSFFEQLRKITRNEIKSYDPSFEDPVEVILTEYFKINPYHLPLRSRFMKWFKQYEKTSPRCHEDLVYVPIYFFPTSKNYDKLFLNFVLTVTLIDIDDSSQGDKNFMTDFAIKCLKTLNPDPTLPTSILEFIKAMIGFLSGVDDYLKKYYLLIMVEFFEGCQTEHKVDRWSQSFDEYLENRRDVILLRMYTYAIWIIEDRFDRKEFDLVFDIMRDVDEWGVMMNDHLSVWKEIEEEDPGNWILIKCKQTGETFNDVYTEQFKQTLDKTYVLMNKLQMVDLANNTDIGKNILHFVAGIYIYGISIVNDTKLGIVNVDQEQNLGRNVKIK